DSPIDTPPSTPGVPTRVPPCIACSIALLIAASPIVAQNPPALETPRITAMGQPPVWQPYTSGVATFGRNNDAVGGLALGLFRPKGSPVNGVFGLAGEADLLAGDGRATR